MGIQGQNLGGYKLTLGPRFRGDERQRWGRGVSYTVVRCGMVTTSVTIAGAVRLRARGN